MTDARFEDGGERPLRLAAETPEDLEVLSALVQDAVGRSGDAAWLRGRRRFVLLINRFRWEDQRRAEASGRPYERVRSMLSIDDVIRVRASGVDPADPDQLFSLLAIAFEPGEDGAGTLRLTLSGDGEVAVEVECLSLRLEDVTRPYLAPSRKAPKHPE